MHKAICIKIPTAAGDCNYKRFFTLMKIYKFSFYFPPGEIDNEHVRIKDDTFISGELGVELLMNKKKFNECFMVIK